MDKSNDTPQMSYLIDHFNSRMYLERDQAFIDNKLRLLEGKVVVHGWLLLAFIVMLLYTLNAFYFMYQSLMAKGISSLVHVWYAYPLMILPLGFAYFVNHRKKGARGLAMAFFSYLVIISAPTLNLGTLLVSLVWFFYFKNAKRVTYTFVK